MMVLLFSLAFKLRRWETGVHSDSWTLVGVASMSLSESLRGFFEGDGPVSDSDLAERLKEGRFQLAVFDATTAAGADSDREGDEPWYEYGIIPAVAPGARKEVTGAHIKTSWKSPQPRKPRHIPFMALKYASRIIFLAALVGLIALLGYYFQPLDDTPFELFMDSQGFGVQFLFALLGTAIALFWNSFVEGLAAVGPFARMAQRPRPAGQSVLLSPCINNVISGALLSVRQRHFLLLAAAFMAGIAEIFLPALLANVPFALTQTYAGYVASTATTLAVLSVMMAVLLASLVFSRWPHLPVDPRTLAEAIYYVSESSQLKTDLCGRRLALMDETSRNDEVKTLDRQYFYGRLGGDGETERMVLEVERVDNDGRWI